LLNTLIDAWLERKVPQGEAKGRRQFPQREAREVSIPAHYEGHIWYIETFHEGLPQDGIGCPVDSNPEMLIQSKIQMRVVESACDKISLDSDV